MRTLGTAVLSLFTALSGPIAPGANAATPALRAEPSAAQPQAASKPKDPVAGRGWPQEVTSGGITYQVFQPRLTGIDASRAYFVTDVAMTGTDGKVRIGEARLAAEVMAADIPGEVEINHFTVKQFTLDGQAMDVASSESKALSDALYFAAMTSDRAALARSVRLVNPRASSTPGLRHDAPAIVVTQQPTVLVQLDGEPRLVVLGNSGWMRAANTPSVLLKSPDGAWMTRVSGTWKSSKSLASGYADCPAPPADVVAAMGPAPTPPAGLKDVKPAVGAPKPAPATVMVATKPTVLVAIDGAPKLADAAPGVQAVSNTPATLLTTDGNAFWLLAAGRWFTTADLGSGAWTYAEPATVPQAFAQLPSTRRWDHVRASVPGTAEANEATLAARELRTVTLARAGATPAMTVDGAAEWTVIPGTQVSWLVNASQPAVRSGGIVYACESGAWFEAPNEKGPWKLCDRVPDEAYSIPASCPIYPCTYVWVVGSTADSVTFAFSPGYLGTYVVDGTPVHGTGHAYPQTSADSYDAYPQTYVGDPAYDSQTGTFCPPVNAVGSTWYGAPDMWPGYANGCGWTGYGWCCGWNNAWGWGYGAWGAWDHWGGWMNQWHPYYDRWNGQHAAWEQQTRRDAAQRTAQRGQPLGTRTWPASRGDMSAAKPGTFRPAAKPAMARDASPAAARETNEAVQRQYQGVAQDAPAAFRGPGNEYGGYDPVAYRPWTGEGSLYGGNWGYEPLARPNGFHPPQQFAAPGSYWMSPRTGANAGPYSTPAGAGDHGGWGTYDRWAGEGVRGTEWGGRNDGRGSRDGREGGGRR
jgi:hypothetical protein